MAGINIDNRFVPGNGQPWWRRCFASATATIVTVNVLVFLVVGAVAAFARFDLSAWLGLLGPVGVWLYRPWGLLTYMFVQTNILHLLFNMIWFWGFATMMVRFDSPARMVGTYIAGGLGGGLCFLVATTLAGAPGASLLIGSSASVMAVIAGAAARQPRIRVGLVFFGQVELRVIVLIAIVLLGVIPGLDNLPTLAAHLGGALTGWIYILVVSRRTGYAMPRPRTRRDDKRPISQVRAHQRRGLNEEQQREMDALLAKVKAGGYRSLTTEEKQRLFQISSFIK